MSILDKDLILQGFRNRASTRYYEPSKKISEEDFNYILEFARLSPSSIGSEPWKFIVIQNKALREKLKPVSWGVATQLDNASHVVVILAKKNLRYDSDFIDQTLERRKLTGEQKVKAKEKYKTFQSEDMKLLDSERTLFDWASKQTYIALANMMTGAAFMGIDSCPIEGFHYDTVNQILSDEKLFDPKEWGVSVIVTFGYRAKDITPKSRKVLEEIVTWAN